ncbi:Predicted PurR-regulated permease PerM [Actinopolymorpha cephalotaxi]|uniref:PurR-regulated permease PerM n=1 Tax=Actinopolymorpha cephalotaxi TaxID=504797 RepID=A0A1I2ZG29_9ACTN|nr:AI-2E family transporter [Actinopolymorpha cephalotaxi]NYH81955.1 putative PurR-regulated permease PerM [Actinopolymorpha cephalotaxi]SFH36469.1 Predicted PurR-regulated permease PerM [Actinopolymorpha cephalotaxi]
MGEQNAPGGARSGAGDAGQSSGAPGSVGQDRPAPNGGSVPNGGSTSAHESGPGGATPTASTATLPAGPGAEAEAGVRAGERSEARPGSGTTERSRGGSEPDDPAADGGDDGDDGDGPRFGRPGPRISRRSPFYLGFFGALGALLAWQLFNLLASASSVLVLLVVSLYLAVGLNPAVEWFVRRRIGRGVAVALVFLCLVVVFALIGLAIIPVVTKQVTLLINQVPDWFTTLRNNPNLLSLDDQYHVTKKVQDYITSGGLAERLFGGVVGASRIVASTVFGAFTILVLTLYFLGSLPTTKTALYKLVPRSRRDRVSMLGDEILARVGSYVGGQLAVAAIAASASFVFFLIVGLSEYALALAIVVAILGLIPLIGGAVSAVVATSIGLLTDVKIGIACIIYYVIYQQIENYLIYPRIMQRSVKVPGTVIVVAALAGGSLLGIVGALLAVPTAAAILLLIREVLHPRLEEA